MLVDDGKDLRRAGCRLLSRLGYQVVTAENGQEALDLLTAGDHEIDLVLSDVVMPNLSGKELYEALQRMSDPPSIIFTSGYSASELGSGDLLDPSLPLVSKPRELPELAAKIWAALGAGDP